MTAQTTKKADAKKRPLSFLLCLLFKVCGSKTFGNIEYDGFHFGVDNNNDSVLVAPLIIDDGSGSVVASEACSSESAPRLTEMLDVDVLVLSFGLICG